MLHVGDKFESTQSFFQKLEDKTYVDTKNYYWLRDSHTLKTQIKGFSESDCIKKCDIEKLSDYYVRIYCIKGGRKHVSGKNKVKKTFT
jgi:hypothetical protein